MSLDLDLSSLLARDEVRSAFQSLSPLIKASLGRPDREGRRQELRKATAERNEAFIRRLRKLGSARSWRGRFPLADFAKVFDEMMGAVRGSGFRDVGGRVKTEMCKWNSHLTMMVSIAAQLLEKDRDGPCVIEDFEIAGSLAKGTAVCPKSADLDLVVIMRDFDPSKYNEYMDWIEDVLGAQSGFEGAVGRREFYFLAMLGQSAAARSRGARSDGRSTGREVSYFVDEDREFVKRGAKYVHIQPDSGSGVDVLVGGRVREVAEVFRADNEDEWALWSASCNKLCVKFVRDRPEAVLTAIRALKAWRDSLEIGPRGRRPSSFLLELLAIWVSGSLKTPAPRAVFVKVLELLSQRDLGQSRGRGGAAKILWTEHYRRDEISAQVLEQVPLVLDPVKKWNNIVRRRNLSIIRPHARLALKLLETSSDEK